MIFNLHITCFNSHLKSYFVVLKYTIGHPQVFEGIQTRIKQEKSIHQIYIYVFKSFV